jgi:hypothetical protein
MDELQAEIKIMEKIQSTKGGNIKSRLSMDKNRELDGMKATITMKERIIRGS